MGRRSGATGPFPRPESPGERRGARAAARQPFMAHRRGHGLGMFRTRVDSNGRGKRIGGMKFELGGVFRMQAVCLSRMWCRVGAEREVRVW